MNRQILTKIMNILFSFLLSLFTLYFACGVILNFTFLNKPYLDRTFDSKFFDRYYGELVTSLQSLSPASGVDESFFETAVDKKTFAADTRSFIDSCFDGSDSSAVRVRLNTRVEGEFNSALETYTKNAGYELTDSVRDALSHLSSVCAQYYTDMAAGKITGYAFALVSSFTTRFSKIVYPAIVACFAMMIFCLGYLVHLNRKTPSALVRNVSCAWAGTSLMMIVIPIGVFLCGVLRRVGIMSDALRLALADYVGGILSVFLISGLALFGAVAVFAYFVGKMIKSLQNRA